MLEKKNRYVHWLLALCLLCAISISTAFAESHTKPLSENQAFEFSVTINSPSEILAKWEIAPGYFLYKNRLQMKVKDGEIVYHLPDKSIQHNNFHVYSGSLQIPVKVTSTRQPVILQVNYQGCSQDGFCYPAVDKTLVLDMKNGIVTEVNAISMKSLFTNQYDIQAFLGAMNLGFVLAIFFILGLLLALTPCVLPMVPILTGIIIGQKEMVTKRKALLLSLAYVLGMSVTYALAGMLTASLGSSVQVWLQQPIFIAVSAGIFVLLALSLLGFYEFHVSRHWQNLVMRWSNYHQGGNYAGVFSMGVISTLIVSPCVTAPLIGVLMYVSQTGNLMIGGSVLFVMGLGMGVPLLLVGMSAGNWLPKSGPWMELIKKSFGFLMLGIAIWLLSRVISPQVITVFWFVLAIIIAWMLFDTIPKLIGRRMLSRTVGVFVAVTAIFFFANTWHQGETRKLTENHFTVVANMAELDHQLHIAQLSKRPVMIDFYADWCESCLAMEKKVFANSKVGDLMKAFVLLRIDLSINNADSAAFLKRYDVIAPPTVLFFNANGQEINSRRIIGEVDAQEFSTRLNLFFAQGCDTKQYC